ncbi:MAG: glycoside hydrolase family 43 protein [Dysgonamonadaceae bacterium]|nr:glycoside hydrolase family 43 protein [Dysgonamonadaceae bacterium]
MRFACVNPLLPTGADPWATYVNGTYYYTQGCEDRIIIWKTENIADLKNAERKEVWLPKDNNNAHHIWGPEIHYLNNKWYIYFSADNGNTDNHQIYVIENSSSDPLLGEFVMKGRIATDADNNWAIHANVFEHAGNLYMIWSGWQSRRIETENQCIYIALMENPWTLKSGRVLLSKPELEWERQWISPDGSKTAYPIYVNEAPQFLQSKNADKLFIFYSASGRWTPYYALGMLTANAGSNLLDPASWTKSPKPVFKQSASNEVYAPGSICFVPSRDGKNTCFIYHARRIPNDAPGDIDSRSPRMQILEWTVEGTPQFGIPVAEGKIEF